MHTWRTRSYQLRKGHSRGRLAPGKAQAWTDTHAEGTVARSPNYNFREEKYWENMGARISAEEKEIVYVWARILDKQGIKHDKKKLRS